MSEVVAALYEQPFKLVEERVKPYRAAIANADLNRHWWRLWRTRPELLKATENLHRVAVTPRISKHRVFIWQPTTVVPDTAVVVIAFDDDARFGVLQSRFHEAWALRLGSSLEDRPRYTPSSTFETFPFPAGMTPDIASQSVTAMAHAKAVGEAAKRLDDLRTAWLNPPELVKVEPEVASGFPKRVLPRDEAAAKQLAKRTLTALYNQRPTWLENAHAELDDAVAAAYGWDANISTEDAMERLLELNLQRTQGAIAA